MGARHAVTILGSHPIHERIAMRKKPWHAVAPKSSKFAVALVYHDNSVCMEGDNIPENDKREGTDNRLICPQCERLDAAGR